MPVTINGSNTPTAGGVVYGDGTNYASTAAGTSGQVLTSAGAGAPTWATPSTGALTLISTATASSSASIIFTGLTGYKWYMLEFEALYPSASATNLQVQGSRDNGATYISAGYESTYLYLYNSSYNNNRSYGDSAIYLTGAFSPNYSGFSGVAYLHGCGTSSSLLFGVTHQSVIYDSVVVGNSVVMGGGFVNIASAVNAIKIFPASGNLASGTVKLYGVS